MTISFFRFENNKFWAFKMMQEAKKPLSMVPGLTFYKILGTGGGNTFQFYPNLKVYGLLGVWRAEHDAEAFFSQNDIFQEYRRRSEEQKTYYMETIKSHGKWSGDNPFTANVEAVSHEPVAVITRARIRTGALLEFWRKVPSVSDDLLNVSNRIFSVGIGEWPIIQQATFSLWTSEEAMKDAIYNNDKHHEVIQLTRSHNWYSEELFARFRPFKEIGTWMGQSVSIPAAS